MFWEFFLFHLELCFHSYGPSNIGKEIRISEEFSAERCGLTDERNFHFASMGRLNNFLSKLIILEKFLLFDNKIKFLSPKMLKIPEGGLSWVVLYWFVCIDEISTDKNSNELEIEKIFKLFLNWN